MGAMDLWFGIEEDMWPAVADDLTRYSRGVLEQTEAYPVSKFARAVRAREQLTLDAAALSEEVDVLLTPTTAVHASPPAGPPLRDTMAQPFPTPANLAWNPSHPEP